MVAPRRDAVIDTLRQRFLSASHLGLIRPGDKLPSARDIARELGVDRRVVLAAYRQLEGEGVLQLRQRSGIYFAPAAAGQPAANPARQDWMVDFLTEAVSRGVAVPALADELHRSVRTLRLRAACIECNADQTAALCAVLAADFGFETASVEVDPLRDVTTLLGADGEGIDLGDPNRAPTALRRADLLVTTPFHAGDVQLLAERLGKPWLAVALRADVFAELARLLEQGPACAVVADPRFAQKLETIYRSTAGKRHFRALVAGRDDLTQIPPDMPTFVTQLARDRLAGADVLRTQEISEPRALATGSVRELVTFVVRANAAALTSRGGA